MKNFLVVGLLVLAFSTAACAQQADEVEKTTFLYAVKGADSLRLDRYAVQDGGRDKPCMVFVFGGGFVSGERDNARYIPYFRYWAERGYVVVSIDYRLGLRKLVHGGQQPSPAGFVMALGRTVAMAVEDLYDATGYVLDHAGVWGVDPGMVVTCGSSAGAVTVLQAEYELCNATPLAGRLPEGFRYAGVISFAGAVLGAGDSLQWGAKPAPIQLFHGDADSNVPYYSLTESGAGLFGSKYIAGQLARMESPYYFYSVINAAHEISGDPMDQNREEIGIFLDRMVRRREPLMIDTQVRVVGRPDVKKEFTLMDYVRTNFGPR